MFGILSYEQMEEVLKKSVIGRIGCATESEVYVVPISFVYDDNSIICHTTEGKKIAIMRNNPNVCFEIEEMINMGNWRSVVIQGSFEELIERAERNKAMKALLNRRLPVISSVTTHLGKQWPFHSDDVTSINGIVFRIAIKEMSGRFESSDDSLFLPE